MNLTCEICRTAPGKFLLVADLGHVSPPARRVMMLTCDDCGRVQLKVVTKMGDAGWLFRLMPEQQAGDGTITLPPDAIQF